MIFYDPTGFRKFISKTIFLVLAVFILLLVFTSWSAIYAGATTSTNFEPISEADDMHIALTFDDGPDPFYTPAILDILAEKNVPATFFFIGKSVVKNPEVAKQVYDAGHVVGNHSFTHSPNVHRNQKRLRFEVETTNQIIEQIIGERPRFYRSPFLDDFGDANNEFIYNTKLPSDHPVTWLNELGYVGVSAYIDPRDWETKDPAVLVRRVIERTEHGNILLLHDGGDQRDVTLEALPRIIDELKAQGFVFVSLNELSGINSYFTPPDTMVASLQGFSVVFMGTIYTQFPSVLFVMTIFILALGFIKLAILAGILKLFPRPAKPKIRQGGVSVLIPAYNEEQNIVATIKSVVASTHEKLEVIVIDDGSKDDTKEVVLATARAYKTPVHYIYKSNGGKADALNLGLKYADYDIVVAIDGDTIVHPDAVTHLVSHFNEQKTGAVAGRVSAVTGNSWLDWFQDIEYTVSQNIEKTAFNSLFGSISVIPGAIGAWRRDVVLAAGGYSDDTQVEDQDLTLAIHQQGYRVIYDHCAVAYTEVPSTVEFFIKQRFRWLFGTLQCLWKYKGYLGDPIRTQLGWVILPYGIIFTVLIPVLVPVVDITLIYALVSGNWGGMATAALIFTAIDLVYHAFGLLPEPKKLWYLPLVPLQRLFYRMVISYVILKSLLFILAGTRTFWAAQVRTGSAEALFSVDQKFADEVVLNKSISAH